MWLEVAASNNDPYVVCKYYANCIFNLNGLPNIVRCDRGTENVNLELMQKFLRTGNDDETAHVQSTFLYGKSTANQRIESWWSKFKLTGISVWIEHFKQLECSGVIDITRELDIECIRFCYMALLRDELRNITMLWNTHHIRSSKSISSPHGKPDIMCHLPQMYGASDYLRALLPDELEPLSEILIRDIPDNKYPYHDFFHTLITDANNQMPGSLDDADDMLVYLLDCTDNYNI